ncbi:hypothetical protein PsW64_03601 [Pseudovibrio sp. W64]|nr:hypothetical protein PsW64_03601 [Pseudovibrio sp. W64]
MRAKKQLLFNEQHLYLNRLLKGSILVACDGPESFV